jgi:4-hydroxy-2-oxoheptanedioate aldolase
MAAFGIDWIIVDLEHGPIDLGSAHAMITATAARPAWPMVRIAANEPWLAKAPMDLGRARHQFSNDLQPRRRREGRAQRTLPAKGRPAVGPVPRAVRWGVSMADYMATPTTT